ncbi:MAG: NADH-quinone oxidoreductase subunit NuoG [Inhella sp.]|uniref:NADH-quinone oxidoreductase subunit NuoG n=1 Tax=Inhella sp. TaxID=1921806 RepID=UPI0022BDE4FF|nr:NADH-quinone oxidoreductase subunit NuoG [Inhella sp.]MCZ8236067.1 NADH-quinone oxidoreductase subunit NuoG [Inhella sp.]
MVEIELDGQKVEVPEGSMVMHAADKLGTYVPHFCYHKKLSIAANCRMCLVDVEKAPKPMPACATPVTPGMIVRTKSDKAVKAQQGVMEFLLINHPLDCPICDQGGECQLQDLAVGYGGSKSRYAEEKRVVFHKNVGPLISMQEMSRCIHCTRCVRFGQEIAGVMELGMPNRGEHSEITTFVGRTVDSELSGNMIDLCPVGALTSKPFRYSARTWELSRRKSVSPHDSNGANLVVQVKANQVMRVVPLENDAVNECWISDRDRFSYEGLNSEARLTRPMIKQDGSWQMVDWPTALNYVAHGLRSIRQDHGPAALAAWVSPQATLEEGGLLARLLRALGSENIDHALRQNDDRLRPTAGEAMTLGRSIASLSKLDGAWIIGSALRKDHPLMAQRLRQAARHGATIMALHAANDDWLMPVAPHNAVAPSAWVTFVAGVAAAVSEAKGLPAPVSATISPEARATADVLLRGGDVAILLGQAAGDHPQAAELWSLAQWIGAQTGATVGFLGQGGNAVGLQAVGVGPGNGGRGWRQQTQGEAPKAVVLLGVDPLLDTGDAAASAATLRQAQMVVGLSSHRTDALLDHADVLLPTAPFTETSGSFVTADAQLQSFVGVVPPLGETRPAWKVVRVLANLLDLPGFDFEGTDQIRAALLPQGLAVTPLLGQAMPTTLGHAEGLQRLAELPIYASDMLVRHAPSLQATRDGQDAGVAQLPPGLWSHLGLAEGGEDMVRVTQGAAHVTLPARRNERLAEGVVRVAAGLPLTAALGASFAPIQVAHADAVAGGAQ